MGSPLGKGMFFFLASAMLMAPSAAVQADNVDGGGAYPPGWGGQPQGYELIGSQSLSVVGNAVLLSRLVEEDGELFLTVIAKPYEDALIQHPNINLRTNYGSYVNATFSSDNASARTPAILDPVDGSVLEPSQPGVFYMVDAVSGAKLPYIAEIESYRTGEKYAMTPEDMRTIGGAAGRLDNAVATHSFNFLAKWADIESNPAGLYADVITARFDAVPLIPN